MEKLFKLSRAVGGSLHIYRIPPYRERPWSVEVKLTTPRGWGVGGGAFRACRHIDDYDESVFDEIACEMREEMLLHGWEVGEVV